MLQVSSGFSVHSCKFYFVVMLRAEDVEQGPLLCTQRAGKCARLLSTMMAAAIAAAAAAAAALCVLLRH